MTCARTLVGLGSTDAVAVLGPIDALKLRSSMTLFAAADPTQPVFRAVILQLFGGEPDSATTVLLTSAPDTDGGPLVR